MPKLRTYAELFAGGGGWAEGAKAVGLVGLWAIERDKRIAQIHHVNNPTVPMYVHSVEDVDPVDLLASYGPIDALFASPPCQGWSKARTAAGRYQKHGDKDIATSIVAYVATLRPTVLFVENVPEFANYALFRAFRLAIEQLGYLTKLTTVDMSDFGVPQTRLRVILSCTKSPLRPIDPYRNVSLEAVDRPKPWFPAVADLFHGFPHDTIPPSIANGLPFPNDLALSYESLAASLTNVRIRKSGKIHTSSHYPSEIVALAIQSAHSTRTRPTYRASTQPMFTVVASLAKQPTRILMPTGAVFRMTMRANARIQTFPDTYRVPINQTLAGQIIGNAVPPLFVRKLLEMYVS